MKNKIIIAVIFCMCGLFVQAKYPVHYSRRSKSSNIPGRPGFRRNVNFSHQNNFKAVRQSKEQLVQNVHNYLQRGKLSGRNFHIFLKHMALAKYPNIGADTIIKFRKEYIDTGTYPSQKSLRKGEIVMAAANLEPVANVVVPEYNAFVKKAPELWIMKYGPYWCIAAKITKISYFNDRIDKRRLKNYLLLWAQVFGNADSVYIYARKNVKNMDMLMLLDSGFKLKSKYISEILEHYFSLPIPLILRGRYLPKKTLSKNVYPVLDRILLNKHGENVDWLYQLVLHPQAYKINRHSPKNDTGIKIIFPKNSTNWSSLIHNWDMLQFFYSEKRRKKFFELLWGKKGNPNYRSMLVAGGPVIIPLLLQKIKDKKPLSSIIACEIIADMGPEAIIAIIPLITKLQASDSFLVKSAIIRAMAKMKAINAIPALNKVVAKEKNKIVYETAKKALVVLNKEASGKLK